MCVHVAIKIVEKSPTASGKVVTLNLLGRFWKIKKSLRGVEKCTDLARISGEISTPFRGSLAACRRRG